eukprot:scaffold2570_cov436-Prasinococcus_capsulatus_cf.AAC.8
MRGVQAKYKHMYSLRTVHTFTPVPGKTPVRPSQECGLAAKEVHDACAPTGLTVCSANHGLANSRATQPVRRLGTDQQGRQLGYPQPRGGVGGTARRARLEG